MSYIPKEVFEAHNELSNVFIDELGKDVLLYYSNPNYTSVNSNGPLGMGDTDVFGNPSKITDFAGGNSMQEPVSPVGETLLTPETIKARVYWTDANTIFRSINVKIDGRSCKIICYKKDIPKFSRAKYIEIESKDNPLLKNKARLIKGFIPYGLGESTKFCVSYWEVLG